MKTRRYLVSSGLLVGLLLLSATLSVQATATDLVAIWLQSRCSVGNKGQLAIQLAQAGPAVEPALISAAQNGPDPNTLLQIQLTAGTQFDELQSWIGPNGAQIGLSVNDIQLVQAQSRDQFVADAVQNAMIAYQSRALVGLGIIADSAAIQVLQSFSSSNGSPLQSVAARVLAGVFSTFSAKLEISSRGFELNAKFGLEANSNGINPASEAVKLQVGTFLVVIPPASFTTTKNGSFVFEGVIDGVKVESRIKPLGKSSFEFTVEGGGVDLAALPNPVTVALTIGNERGRVAVSAEYD